MSSLKAKLFIAFTALLWVLRFLSDASLLNILVTKFEVFDRRKIKLARQLTFSFVIYNMAKHMKL